MTANSVLPTTLPSTFGAATANNVLPTTLPFTLSTATAPATSWSISNIYNVQYTLVDGSTGNVSFRKDGPARAILTTRRQLLNTGKRDFVIDRVIDEATQQVVWSK